MKARLLCCLVLLLSTSCSYRYRISDPQLASADVMKYLGDAEQGANLSIQSANGQDLASDPNTTVFFADAPSPLGTINSTLAFDDLNWFGISDSIADVVGVRVFFLDNSANSPRNVLIIGIQTVNQSDYVYYSFTGDGSVNGGEFSATMNGNSGTIVVRSFDTDGDQLQSSIQLRVFDTDGDYVGKFSILAGYR